MNHMSNIDNATPATPVHRLTGNDIRVAAKKWPTGKRAVLAADLAAGRILVERPTIIQAARIRKGRHRVRPGRAQKHR